ncbi:MAG: hypothetical protein OEZ57_02615 [Nitrospirota bacterium]|nr:hypothetical protein [Nitrospirota bacterium]MDH5585673.1 hypothetical protein [Nitrospirota bacterium]MDH5773795.1 hypothetical protein [Nitrospirota bacterium]
MDAVMVFSMQSAAWPISSVVEVGQDMRRTCVSKEIREHVPHYINSLTTSPDIPETGLV